MMESISLDKSSVSSSYGNNSTRTTQEHGNLNGYTGTNGISTGKKKTDQVVVEFLYKTVEVILLSRTYFQPSTPRRARFNLDIQELPSVRDSLRSYRDNVNEPLYLDIYMGTTLLERWYILYTNGTQTQSPVDVINQLREVCRRIGILLRTVYCLARILPAYPVGNRLKCQQEDLGHSLHGLQYKLGTIDTEMELQFETIEPKQRYSFVPVETPFGILQLSVLYRKRNDDLLVLIQQMSPPAMNSRQGDNPPHTFGEMEEEHEHASLQISSNLDNAIITDYVPTTPKAYVAPPTHVMQIPVKKQAEENVTPRRSSSVDEYVHRTSEPVSIPQSARAAPTPIAKGIPRPARYEPNLHTINTQEDRHDSIPFIKHAHSYDTSELLRQRPTTPQAIAAPYGYIQPRPNDAPNITNPSPQPSPNPSPNFHPNSAPIPRASPYQATPPVRYLDGFSLDSPSLKPASVESNRSSGSSLPPFSVLPHGKSSHSLFSVSQSPPFRGYSGELMSASPNTSTPPPRLTFKADRRNSIDVGSNWGISPDTPESFGLGGVRDDESNDLCLPFASKSTISDAATNVSSFLQQLKLAPPLHVNSENAMATMESELAYFKQLRDELE